LRRVGAGHTGDLTTGAARFEHCYERRATGTGNRTAANRGMHCQERDSGGFVTGKEVEVRSGIDSDLAPRPFDGHEVTRLDGTCPQTTGSFRIVDHDAQDGQCVLGARQPERIDAPRLRLAGWHPHYYVRPWRASPASQGRSA
jgi:hypothetical protein